MSWSTRLKAIFFAISLVISILLIEIKYDWFSTFAYTSDVFSYSRALANTAGGKFLWDPTHSFLFGNHSYIVLLAFLPIYLFFNSAFILISSSVLSHLAAVFFVYGLSNIFFGSTLLSIFVASTYLLNVYVLEHVLMPVYAFQPDVLAPAFIFGSLYFYYKDRFYLTLVFFTFLAAVKEEFALFSFGLSAFLFLDMFYQKNIPALSFGASSKSEVSYRRSILLMMYSSLLIIISFGVLFYARKVTAFSHATIVTGSDILASWRVSNLPAAVSHLCFYLRPLGYFIFLAPEFVFVTLPRIILNFIAYPTHSPVDMSMGSAWAWGNISVINLLFLAFLQTLKRSILLLRLHTGILTILVSGILLYNLFLIYNPLYLGFESAIYRWSSGFNHNQHALAERLRHSILKVKNDYLKSTSDDVIICVSSKLFAAFPERNAVAIGFALNVNRTLLSESSFVVLASDDITHLEKMEKEGLFSKVFTDENLILYQKISNPS